MNIEQHEQMSPGGTCTPLVKLVAVSPSNQNIGVPPEGVGIMIGDFTGSVVNNVVQLNAVRDTIGFEEQQIDVNGTIMYRQVVRMIVSRPTFDRLNNLARITSSQWMVFVTNNLDEQKMIGRKQGGATCRFSTAMKTERIERNEAVVEFVSTQPRPAPTVVNPL